MKLRKGYDPKNPLTAQRYINIRRHEKINDGLTTCLFIACCFLLYAILIG